MELDPINVRVEYKSGYYGYFGTNIISLGALFLELWYFL